jgi:hypothetical protein
MTAQTSSTVEAYIVRVVAAAPPLTEAQKAKLRPLLSGSGR